MPQKVDKPRFDKGKFIRDKLGQFWDEVQNIEEVSAMWEVYAQIISSMIRRLYEIDSDMSIQSITPHQMNLGGIKKTEQNRIQRIKLDNEVASVPEVHSRLLYPKTVYFEGTDYEIVEKGGDHFIDFGRGPEAPGALLSDEIGAENSSYVFVPVEMHESNKIAQRFGSLTGLVEKDSDDYLRSVRGLWYALHFGPTPENLRVALYIFLNLPFTDQQGIISNIDRDNNVVTINETKRRESVIFNPNNPKFNMKEIQRGGETWKEISLVKHIPQNYQDPLDLRVIYENQMDPEKYEYRVEDRFWFTDGRKLLVREDFFNTIFFDYNSLIFVYHVPQSGSVTDYDLGRLHMRDDIQENDTIDKFSILTKNIEVKDLSNSRFEWIFNRRPPGLFHIVIDGAAFTRVEKTKRMFEFFERFKPNHADVKFLLKRLPIHATNIGKARSGGLLRDMLKSNKKPLFETSKDITISKKIKNSPEKFHDASIDNELDRYIFWDHFEHSYSQDNNIPRTWGELNESDRKWDEYNATKHEHGKWDISNNLSVLASINKVFTNNEIYLEIKSKTVNGDHYIELVRPDIPNNHKNHSGIVKEIRLDSKSIVLENGDEFYVDSQTQWSSTFSGLESIVHKGSFYSEVNVQSQNNSMARTVKEKIEGNSDYYGEIKKIDLKNESFFIDHNGLNEIENGNETTWGDGPHWGKTKILWDQFLDETIPTWDNRLLSVDREWGETGLEWDENATWPFAQYFGTVDWDNYSERWDMHTLYDSPTF